MTLQLQKRQDRALRVPPGDRKSGIPAATLYVGTEQSDSADSSRLSRPAALQPRRWSVRANLQPAPDRNAMLLHFSEKMNSAADAIAFMVINEVVRIKIVWRPTLWTLLVRRATLILNLELCALNLELF
jgi:hypothetical protein